MEGTTDEQLLAEYIATESNDCFAEIMARMGGYLSLVIVRYVVDNDEAADLVQETFLSLYLHCRQFDGRSSLRSWLTRIAINLAISKLRRASRREKVHDHQELELVEEIDGAGAPRRGIVHLYQRRGGDPAYAAELNENRQRVRDALALMEVNDRRVVEMVHGWDERYDSVAKILGVPIGTVRSKQHRGLKRLRKLLEPGEPPAQIPLSPQS